MNHAIATAVKTCVQTTRTILISANDTLRILIFGHKEFSQLLSSVLPEFKDRAECRIVDAIVGTIDEATTHVKAFSPDLVISAGSNAAYLQSSLDVPVMSLPVTESDIISAISKAAKVSDELHLITYDNYSRLVSLLSETAKIRIYHHIYETADEARQMYHLAKVKENQAVVGASLVCGLAVQDKRKSFLIYSKESCRRLMNQAIEKAKTQKQSINTRAIHRWLYKDSKTPILILDKFTQVLSVNDAAYTEFEITPGKQKGLESRLGTAQFSDITDGQCRIGNKDWWFHRDSINVSNHQVDIFQFYAQNPDIPKTEQASSPDDELVYQSKAMQKLIKKTELFAQTPSHVLIIGESGTGKEMIARKIYQQGSFSKGQFVAINCAAMPSELFESELFGYVDGSFTGSRRGGKHGLLYEADNGVLFLDEVGELSLPQQAKLLRVIQEKTYRPIGSHKEFKVNLKIVAATNRALDEQVKNGLFRSDLYYRLNVLSIHVPSLQARQGDIKVIASNKLQTINMGRLSDAQLNIILDAILPSFESYSWPGNIRELENIIERLLVYCMDAENLDNSVITSLTRELAPELFASQSEENAGAIAESENLLLNQAMTKFNGNKELVARYLGISQTTLWRRLKRINQNKIRGKHHA